MRASSTGYHATSIECDLKLYSALLSPDCRAMGQDFQVAEKYSGNIFRAFALILAHCIAI